jgi:hypothetical protein
MFIVQVAGELLGAILLQVHGCEMDKSSSSSETAV